MELSKGVPFDYSLSSIPNKKRIDNIKRYRTIFAVKSLLVLLYLVFIGII